VIAAELVRLAEPVRGFMPPEEGLALHQVGLECAPLGLAVEIGSYCGKSAVYLGTAAREAGGLLVTVDHHRGSEENQPGWEHHDPDVVDPHTGRMDTLPFLRRTLEIAGLERHVIPIVGESTAVASFWRTPIGLLFIDGGHGEAPARADFEHWAPHVVVGGRLAIHDVFPHPADGGQAPYHVYRRALASGRFREVRVVGSLRVLERSPNRGRGRNANRR
jgi:predicted O-methyltransferase YrrM